MLHLPAYLLDRGLTPAADMMALAIVGGFKILGSCVFGVLGNRRSKKNPLAAISLVRAVAISAFLAAPITALSVYVFAAVMGFTWLGTVPLTNGVVAQIFGVNFLSTLLSIVFLGHKVGSFPGAWCSGYAFDLTGSYQALWLFAVRLSLAAAGLCCPIDDRRVERARVGVEA
jgi:predicted MFS family arabinose efflux permease